MSLGEGETRTDTSPEKFQHQTTLKMTDYNKKRASEKTKPAASSETSSGCPLDHKVLKALNHMVQEPKVVVKNFADIVGKTPGKSQLQPINIQLIGTGKNKSRLSWVCQCLAWGI